MQRIVKTSFNPCFTHVLSVSWYLGSAITMNYYCSCFPWKPENDATGLKNLQKLALQCLFGAGLGCDAQKGAGEVLGAARSCARRRCVLCWAQRRGAERELLPPSFSLCLVHPGLPPYPVSHWLWKESDFVGSWLSPPLSPCVSCWQRAWAPALFSYLWSWRPEGIAWSPSPMA